MWLLLLTKELASNLEVTLLWRRLNVPNQTDFVCNLYIGNSINIVQINSC